MTLLKLAMEDKASIPKELLNDCLTPALNESNHLFRVLEDILDLTKEEFN